MQVVLAGVLWSWCYHFLNGVRHLCWDVGIGFERSRRALERLGRGHRFARARRGAVARAAWPLRGVA